MNAGASTALAACALLLCSGCRAAGGAADRTSTPLAPACAGVPPSYRSDVAPLLERYCLGCHVAGGDAGDDHDFTRYETLHAQRRAVLDELEAEAMPPRDRPQPALAERRLLAIWACWGAPDN